MSTTESMKARNIESDFDQEEEDLEKQWLLEGDQEGDEAEDILNEILILTPPDQDDLLKVIAARLGETEAGDEEMAFNEEVSGKLGELHKKKALQTNLAHQVIPP